MKLIGLLYLFFLCFIYIYIYKHKLIQIIWAGSLIKLVYFSRHEDQSTNDERMKSVKDRLGIPNGSSRRSYPILGGRLHFVKFETNKINECLEFINSKQLHRSGIIVLFNQSLLCHVGLLRTSSTGLH